jgi:hypothetical protein
MKTVILAGCSFARAMLAVALIGCGSTDSVAGNADGAGLGTGDDVAVEPAGNDGTVNPPGDSAAVAPALDDAAVIPAGDDAAMRADVRTQPDAPGPTDAQLGNDGATPDGGGPAPEGGTCPASCTTYTDCNSCPQHPFGGWSCNNGVCQFMG